MFENSLQREFSGYVVTQWKQYHKEKTRQKILVAPKHWGVEKHLCCFLGFARSTPPSALGQRAWILARRPQSSASDLSQQITQLKQCN